MSNDYVSMRSIQLKNNILTPRVLDLYRNDNLNLSTIQGTIDPLTEIYRDTYRYIEYPELSEPAKHLIMKTNNIATGIPVDKQPYIHSSQTTIQPRSVDGQFNGPLTYGPMTSPLLTDPKFSYSYTRPLVYRGVNY